MNQEKIGKFISCCRREKNMTQEEVAEVLGVSNKSVSRWENGRTMPDVSLFEPLCDCLGITISELIAGERLEQEKIIEQNEKNVLSIAVTKKELDWLYMLSNVLLACGILITLTMTKLFATTITEHLTTIVSGGLVWGIAILMKYKTEKLLREISQ
ncbi:MAG: helix-turn-helix transcriptional regulator [Lachnospiraceae bacterium]|nr:helix-turn-helix transcriptional regulator [Lachnospiraceae bacterium]